MDLSRNRLNDIQNNSFNRYTNLQYLDLSDNFLQTIEEGAFAPLQQLIALDLTKTRSVTLPRSLFSLSNLQRLFVENNKLTDAVFKTEVTAPLKLLKASKNMLTKIPQFGPFPSLVYLNVSENLISKISVDDFAPYCRLLTLDVTKNPINFDPSNCECRTFMVWAREHNMTVKPSFKCESSPHVNCFPVTFSNKTMTLFNDCEEMIRIKIEIEKARSTWILVVSCVSGVLVCIFLILYCLHRRNKRRNRKLKKAQQLAASNANTELLNGNLKEEAWTFKSIPDQRSLETVNDKM